MAAGHHQSNAHWVNRRAFSLPGFGHIAQVSGTVDLQHVPATDGWCAHGQEVWSWATYGELCQVGQRLADGGPKQEGAHHFVEG